MLSVEQKLHNMMLATLEENIRFDQHLFAEEKDGPRKQYIQDLLVVLNDKLSQQRVRS